MNNQILESEAFIDWVANTKFDEFCTNKGRYEEDLEHYITSNSEELIKEYKTLCSNIK